MRAMREAMERVDVDGPVLLLQEHTPVITTTRSGGTQFVHASDHELHANGIERHETDRGGDVTFHGPGQLVGYPVLRLCQPGARGDLVGYVRALENAMIEVARGLGVQDAHRVDGMTGVWCDAPVVDEETLCALPGRPGVAAERRPVAAERRPGSRNFVQTCRAAHKLVAIGVGVGRGVTRHGFGFNITTDLERYTRHITACGLTGRGVTSLERVLPRVPSRSDVVDAVASAMRAIG
jgi:lipoyl(octanoyl) transferase